VLPRERQQALAHVGFAAGYLPLAERMRVREYLALHANLQGIAEPDGLIEAALDRFRIGHLKGAMGTELSSGQKTLVNMVKATLHRPRLLVLDEPTNALDPEVAKRVRDGLLALCDDLGTALLVTSHQMHEVERLCQRVVFLLGGKVVADGSPADVVARYGSADLEGVFLHLAEEGA
jgi:ABC-2 type transport system ATP-binding protein